MAEEEGHELRPAEKIVLDSGASLRAADLSLVRLGPRPFEGGIKYYEARKETDLSPATIEEDCRKLHLFGRVFEELKNTGAIGSTDPRKFGERHITEFIVWMKSRKTISSNTQAKYLQVINRYLLMFGNYTIIEIRSKKNMRLPHDNGPAEIRALSAEELQEVFNAADKIPGWRGSVIRGYLALGFGTACRPREIANAQKSDLDRESWRFFVRNPKGNGNWANPQWVDIIRKDMWPRISAFMDERDNMIRSAGIRSDYLFFNPDTLKPYTANGLHKIKNEVEEISGISFQLKDLRSTYASLTVKGNPELLKPVSLQLRHSSVKITEKHYAKISKNEEIRKALGNRWEENPIK